MSGTLPLDTASANPGGRVDYCWMLWPQHHHNNDSGALYGDPEYLPSKNLGLL